MDGNDVGMTERSGRARLEQKPLDRVAPADALGPNDFQRHPPAECGVARQVDGAHPSLTQLSNDTKRAHLFAGLEAARSISVGKLTPFGPARLRRVVCGGHRSPLYAVLF